MGFFDALGKVLAGKPIYGPEDAAQGQPGTAPAQPMNAPQRTEAPHQHIVPVVRVDRVESRVNGNRTDVNLVVRNESPVAVWIDKIHVLGTMRDVNDDLQPGESYECTAYSGPIAMNDAHKHAEIVYFTDKERKYFEAMYDVRYQQQSNGWYPIDLRLLLPIKEHH